LHHFAARLRASGFQEAEMSRGDSRFGGQRQLAHVPRVAPLPKHAAECGDSTLRKPKQRVHVYPPSHDPANFELAAITCQVKTRADRGAFPISDETAVLIAYTRRRPV